MILKPNMVLPGLKALERELLLSCEEEIQKHVSLLPFKMLPPLFFLILPSLLLLLVCPLLKMLRL